MNYKKLFKWKEIYEDMFHDLEDYTNEEIEEIYKEHQYILSNGWYEMMTFAREKDIFKKIIK